MTNSTAPAGHQDCDDDGARLEHALLLVGLLAMVLHGCAMILWVLGCKTKMDMQARLRYAAEASRQGTPRAGSTTPPLAVLDPASGSSPPQSATDTDAPSTTRTAAQPPWPLVDSAAAHTTVHGPFASTDDVFDMQLPYPGMDPFHAQDLLSGNAGAMNEPFGTAFFDEEA